VCNYSGGMTLAELKIKKLKLEDDVKSLIEDFIYNTNTVPTNMQLDINFTHSVTKAIVLIDDIDVSFNLGL